MRTWYSEIVTEPSTPICRIRKHPRQPSAASETKSTRLLIPRCANRNIPNVALHRRPFNDRPSLDLYLHQGLIQAMVDLKRGEWGAISILGKISITTWELIIFKTLSPL